MQAGPHPAAEDDGHPGAHVAASSETPAPETQTPADPQLTGEVTAGGER